MQTVLFVACLVAVAAAGTIPKPEFEAKTVDNEFIAKQRKVLSLLQHITQVNVDAEYYKIGKEYDIEHNFEHYTNKKAVEEFLTYYRHGMLPHDAIFSVYNEECRDEAIALYHLFYYAKDFETFYKTAAWARVYLNEGLFVYSFSIAVQHRDDTTGIVLPAPYEVYPYYFVNSDVIAKVQGIKMQRFFIPKWVAPYFSIVEENNVFNIGANYSGWFNNVNQEQKLSYFTEDIGLNTYYYYFHTSMPFWMNGEEFGVLKERRGEIYFNFYQQLLARYYFERLTNGLGEIPELSWRWPIKTGYVPHMVNHNLQPFVSRNNYYQIQNEDNMRDLEYLESYEKQFLQYLEAGKFKAYNKEVDFSDYKSVNFVGNFWQSNADLTTPRNFEQYYEILAQVLLGAAPKTSGKYSTAPIVLKHYQTALRDPVFFQLYKRILYYFLQYKQYLEPYTRETLEFTGVKINDVKVDDLVTYFDYFSFNVSNAAFYSKEELTNVPYSYLVRQARLNHKAFDVKIEVKSDIAADAMVKIFMAPKYDSNGYPITLEDNWMNFFQLDFFKTKLNQGKNDIVRNSEDFFYFKEDSVSTNELYRYLDNGKVPTDMSEYYFLLPNRLMLPKGTHSGFPFQFFVMVYPYVPAQDAGDYKNYILDNKPFGYPLDRPVDELYFYQPNMYFQDVFIKHEGEENVHQYMVPKLDHLKNVVAKH
ncbi:hypothetical protein JYU34_001833 [Plutella xylostella]|uniref:Arylphorin n=1 Tax=Plutella xylostella TaxID=51655 RepID=A0ABQ7R4X6_PLUXY|nr:hypothetical protein EYC86_24060 [Enterobacter hormaechei]KAG7312347.1 hypothetical protein JYU34_001833 [Plutella xylostella]